MSYVTFDEVLADDLTDEFTADWKRWTLAREVASAVILYRVRTGLSQRALARTMGWSQPVVARLEIGEHDPNMGTLLKLAEKLGLRFGITIEDTKFVVTAIQPRQPTSEPAKLAS